MALPKYDRSLSTALQAVPVTPPAGWRSRAAAAVPLHAGFPFPESFPTQDLARATAAVMEREGAEALQYGGGPALRGLQEYLEARSRRHGLYNYPADLVMTAGASQALDLTMRLFINPGDLVAVEAPTFMGALATFRTWTQSFLPVPVDEDGCQVEAFAEILASRKAAGQSLPKLFYVIPTYQNPTGVTMPLERRRRLLELADAYDFLIVEDDAYSSLGFSDPPPRLRSLDASGRVIYVATMSKLIGPGVRLGWVVAHPQIIARYNQVKSDGSNPFAYSVCYEYVRTIDLDQRVDWLRAEYHKRCSALLEALERHMPAGCSWTRPQGGFFTWVRCLEGADMAAILPEANRQGVAYIPGSSFFTDGAGTDYVRLSFSYAQAAEMERGVKVLAGLLR